MVIPALAIAPPPVVVFSDPAPAALPTAVGVPLATSEAASQPAFSGNRAIAQAITPTPDSGTIVTGDGTQFTIQGGRLSADQANLFHSFETFSLSPNQIATFLANPAIQTILSRVVGGDASIIDGRIQVTEGGTDLYLINPAGILFGPNAQIDVSGSFTATTADRIGIGDQWFMVLEANDYGALAGTPHSFGFSSSQPGSIVNRGSLTAGETLMLLAGTVVSNGTLSAQHDAVVAAVTGGSTATITTPGRILTLAPTLPDAIASDSTVLIPIAALPELLAGVGPGDATVEHLRAESATITADNTLRLPASQIHTSGDLTLQAGDTVQIRDNPTDPALIRAGGDLAIRGDGQIDILALNQGDPALQSGGDLTLASDGPISGDTHYASGGRVSFQTTDGNPGHFVSFYDPIITALGDVDLGNYEGVALMVETIGSIEAGNITITGPDTTIIGDDADAVALRSGRTLILRAGQALSALRSRPNVSSTVEVPNPESPAPGITAGLIDTSAVDDAEPGGSVELTAPGNIRVASINTQGTEGGDIRVTTSGTFQVTGTLPDNTLLSDSGNPTSITAQGTNEGGSIDIAVGSPYFFVGSEQVAPEEPDESGTAGVITNSPDETIPGSGDNTISPNANFFGETQGQIAINAAEAAPKPSVDAANPDQPRAEAEVCQPQTIPSPSNYPPDIVAEDEAVRASLCGEEVADTSDEATPDSGTR